MSETLIVTTCRVGNFEVFEKLLRTGADVNVVRRYDICVLQLVIVSDTELHAQDD
jgi:hypothetical protein